jgi:hypothetical protein
VRVAISIEEPAADARVVADRVDEETGREVGTVPVQAIVTTSPDTPVTVTWTSDLAPDTPLLAGATGEVELWLSESCRDTPHQLTATATADSGETATAAVPVTMTCPLDVTITNPEDGAQFEARPTAPPANGETYETTFRVAAAGDTGSNDGELTWAWTSSEMDGVLLDASQGDITLTGEGCGGEAVTHVLTAAAEGNGRSGSDTVQVEVIPPDCQQLP